MYTKSLRSVFATFFVGTLMCAPFMNVHAATSTASLQSQIDSLLKVIAQLQAQLNEVRGGSATSCVALTRTLYVGLSDGETGGEVTKLQRFLGMTPTGFFGPMTEAKVKAWQAQKGIVSSGDADTTGYGLVGARTRALMNRCGDVANMPKPETPDRNAPSCKIWTSNANPEVGERFTISWTTRNMVDPAFNEGLKAGGQYTVEKSGSRTFKELSAYTAQFSISPNLEKYAPLCSVSVDIEGGSLAPSITLLSPNDGGYWYYGQEYLITWSTRNIKDDSEVLVQLTSTDGKYEYDVKTTENDGTERIVVPRSIPPGAYHIEIQTNSGDNTYLDKSSEYIKVIALPEISYFKLTDFDYIAGHWGTFTWSTKNTESCGLYREMINGGKDTILYPAPLTGVHAMPITATEGMNGRATFTFMCTGPSQPDGKDGQSAETRVIIDGFKG